MAGSTVKLSICIPTYNRAEYLRECLRSVFASVSPSLLQEVEIVVSDNASTDDTRVVVGEELQHGYHVLYHTNESNLGCEANLRTAAEIAVGEYLWLVGDDDKLAPDAVGAVLESLRRGADAVICNVALFSRDFQKLVKPRFLGLDSDVSCTNHDRVMELAGGHMGYLSGTILNREAFLRIPFSEYMSFVNDGTCFLYAAYCAIRSCRRVEFLAEPLVLNRGDAPDSDLLPRGRQSPAVDAQPVNAQQAWNRVFAQGFPRTLAVMANHGYGRSAIRRAQNAVVFDYLLPRLLFLKTQGRGSFALAMAALPYLKWTWTFWFLFLPAALLPAFVLCRLKGAKRSLASSLR